MGNSTSNANHLHLEPSTRTSSPHRAASPASRVSKPFRTKKKSLEFPDLASLTLTPATQSPQGSPHGQYRRPRASSPIPIPIAAKPPPPTFKPQNNLPSAAHIPGLNHRSRHRSYLSSAYPSTHSFVSGRDSHSRSPPEPVPEEEPARPAEYVPEVVHSVLPTPLRTEDESARTEPVTVLVRWRRGGRSVFLARAGDNNWAGRQPMQFDSHTNSWTASVQLLPGTHHFKFIVDDQPRIADDYPTAVDDRDGSLANYLNVVPPTSSSTPSHTSPLSSPHYTHPNQFNSFWSDNGGGPASLPAAGTSGESSASSGEWTTEIPPELIQAAAEEEQFLAEADSPSSSSVPAPNIPPAPALPRHLDRLILNVKASAAAGSSASATAGAPERERSRKAGSRSHRRDREGRSRASTLGMTSSVSEGAGMSNGHSESQQEGFPASHTLPVVTASGTDVTALSGTPNTGDAPPETSAVKKMATKLDDGQGLADDASVLPVPNHVVLHHLSTSAIRNGVLAVANTTRYRKKMTDRFEYLQYITTIYYKPT
ncbi:hypothetical protein K474DRAFT_1665873 [Panus rudis PR-1116 ss-1]|nr:hypothetical protein K474DRAFT_1665873 [Panus rudis PR-1116 ss-1]